MYNMYELMIWKKIEDFLAEWKFKKSYIYIYIKLLNLIWNKIKKINLITSIIYSIFNSKLYNNIKILIYIYIII